MRIGLRHLGSETLDWLQARIAAKDCAQVFPARELCGREEWRSAESEPWLAFARAALQKLSPAIDLPLLETLQMDGIIPESLVPSLDFPDRCPGRFSFRQRKRLCVPSKARIRLFPMQILWVWRAK